MNKNTIYTIVLTATLSIFIAACNDSEGPTVPNTGGNPLTGAYILYYSSFTSTDYAFYDASKDSVTDFVFTSNNPGVKLNVNPGEMKLNSDRKLYISALGIPGNNGSIYRINPENNTVEDSLRFGSMPDGFAINNNRIVIANSLSTNVTVLDLDFNIIKDTVEVGSNPVNVLYGFNKYIVTRQLTNTEPSAAFVDEINYSVTKQFFPGVPVSAIYNVNGIFISTSQNKNIYRIESESFTTIDSFAVSSVYPSLGKLIFKSQNSFYVVAGGKEIWLAVANSGTFVFTNIFPASNDINIGSIAYESNSNELYFTSSTNAPGSILYIIDGNNGNVKRFKSLAGNGSKSIVFRYF